MADAPARGCAFGDYDNDGDVDVVVNCMNSIPQLLRCDSSLNRNSIKLKLVGAGSNRSGIGSRVTVTSTNVLLGARPLSQVDELRSGESYLSQNDLRLHFGLNQAMKADLVEVSRLSGQVDRFRDLNANKLYVLQEGGKILRSTQLKPVGATSSLLS